MPNRRFVHYLAILGSRLRGGGWTIDAKFTLLEKQPVDADDPIKIGFGAVWIGMTVVNDEQLFAVGRFDDRVVPGRGDPDAQIRGHQWIILIFCPRTEGVLCRCDSDAIEFVSRIVRRVGHVVGLPFFYYGNALIAAVDVPTHFFPRLRSSGDQSRFTDHARKVFFQFDDIVFSICVTVLISVFAEVEIGGLLLVVVDENMAVDSRMVQIEPRGIKVLERAIGRVTDSQTREQ